MKKILLAVALAAAAIATPALADINVKDASGATVATCSTTVSSTQVPCHQLKNAAGTTINPATSDKQAAPGTAGTPSADVISVQGVVGGQPQPVDTIIRATATNIGATVTANTAATLTAANTSRRGFAIQNQTNGNCYLSGVATATADFNSLLIASGAYYESSPTHVGTGALSIICAAAGGVYARQW